MAKWHNHFVLDVEADGPCPAMFNLISFGFVNVDDPTKTFLGKVAPIIPDPGIEAARAVSDVSFEEQKTFQSSEDVLSKAVEWLANIAGSKRPIIWSDNPAFDWQFWNYYCHRFLGGNPAGFSARRIGDLDAGRRGKPLNTSAWKNTERRHILTIPSMTHLAMLRHLDGFLLRWGRLSDKPPKVHHAAGSSRKVGALLSWWFFDQR